MRFSAALFGGARRVLLRSGISSSSTPPKSNVLLNIEHEKISYVWFDQQEFRTRSPGVLFLQ